MQGLINQYFLTEKMSRYEKMLNFIVERNEIDNYLFTSWLELTQTCREMIRKSILSLLSPPESSIIIKASLCCPSVFAHRISHSSCCHKEMKSQVQLKSRWILTWPDSSQECSLFSFPPMSCPLPLPSHLPPKARFIFSDIIWVTF